MADETRVISGTFGEVWREGKQMVYANEAKAEVEIEMKEIRLSGDRWIGHKATGLKGSGAIKSYKVTSEMIQLHDPIAKNEAGYVMTELIYKLDDPEAFGHERIRLKNVKFNKINLGGWKVGEVIEEEWPFVFKGYELLDPIEES
ncbi:phage tail tube protein [Brevibacillus borstelensis]|uniref:phage tail tube protein n=1 Tax=Brevibacillus borstelensis TaxID=45462 RepID=UPI002E1BB8CD|nr:phage tail tube protein [Brevibacillus borstelensis]